MNRRALLLLFAAALAPLPVAAQGVDRAEVERRALETVNAFLDRVDAGRYQDAIDRFCGGREPTVSLMRTAFEQRKPRGQLSDRRVGRVGGSGGEVQVEIHYTPEFPEERRARRFVLTHVSFR